MAAHLAGRLRCSCSAASSPGWSSWSCWSGSFHEPARLRGAGRQHGRDRGLRRLADARAAGAEPLPEGRPAHGLGRHRPLGHGDPGQRGDVPLDARPGLPGRPRVRPELLRRPAGADPHRGGVPADVPAAERLHGLRVPRPPVRREDPAAGRGACSSCSAACRRGSPSTRRRSSSRRCCTGAPTPRSCSRGWS